MGSKEDFPVENTATTKPLGPEAQGLQRLQSQQEIRRVTAGDAGEGEGRFGLRNHPDLICS